MENQLEQIVTFEWLRVEIISRANWSLLAIIYRLTTNNFDPFGRHFSLV